jgi:hypothetical protein
MSIGAFLTNCRLADGCLVDIGIAGRRIAAVGEGAVPTLSSSTPALDIGGPMAIAIRADTVVGGTQYSAKPSMPTLEWLSRLRTKQETWLSSGSAADRFATNVRCLS